MQQADSMYRETWNVNKEDCENKISRFRKYLLS